MWRPSELLVEARRNLGPAHGVLAVLVGVVAAALVVMLLLSGHAALAHEAQRREAGSLVWTATATDAGGPLSGAACARLVALPGVTASGGQSAEVLPPLSAYPGGIPLSVVGLTPGAVEVFVPGAPWASATLGANLAALGELGPGSWLVDADGKRVVQVNDVIRTAPISALTDAVTVPVPPASKLSSCWIRMEPAAAGFGRDILAGAFTDSRPTIAPFIRAEAGAATPLEEWHRTVDLQPWLAAGLLMAGTVALVLWARRTELAVYRAFGTSRAALAVLATTETVLVSLPALAAGVLASAVAFALANHTGVPRDLELTAVGQALAAVLVALALTPAIVVLVARGDLTSTLRDR